jgi:hypothetical protein
MIYNIDPIKIQDENARELIKRLLNLIEKQTADIRDAQDEIQRFRDEVNRLKGEQGKPKIKGNTPKSGTTNHSSEKERSKPHERRRRSKKAEIQINAEQVVTVDPAILPEDAKFKGYEGQFGPGINALTLILYFGMGTSEPKILEFYANVGIMISKGELSNLLIKDKGGFHAEKDDVY